jgi:hypothetical protein
LSAAGSALLLWLGWLLVGGVARAVPALPPGTTVRFTLYWTAEQRWEGRDYEVTVAEAPNANEPARAAERAGGETAAVAGGGA